jgi:AcrR family transcriptional regulator
VAHRAGLSTETLYRLFPNKAALLEGRMSDRLERLLSVFRATEHQDIEEALCTALTARADLALDACTAVALADWLRAQQIRGLIAPDDVTRLQACCSAWLPPFAD